MKAFSITKSEDKDILSYKISGYLDEQAKLPANIEFPKFLNIDLSDADGINSIGTRSWCEWIAGFKNPTKIKVSFCPTVFLKTFNNVLGAYPNNMEVTSFYVPFVSSKGDERKNVLVQMPLEFKDGGPILPRINDSKGQLMEADVLPNFFNFIKK